MSTILTTLAQSEEIANAVIAKVKEKGYALAENLGAVASLDEIAESNLASALASKINGKADAATTLSGYGITDAYTKTEVDNAIGEAQSSVLKPGGSLGAADVVAALLVAGNLGKVYNLTEDITTTSDFVDGAGHKITAGTNIYIVDVDTTGETPTYKFDVLAGEYGVATQSANGLMSATDKAKLDNADVTAYTGTGAVDVTNHQISVAPASTTDAGLMSATDKAKLDDADVTAYTGSGAVSVANHVISVAPATSSAAGTMSATDKAKLDDFVIATAQDIQDVINDLDEL